MPLTKLKDVRNDVAIRNLIISRFLNSYRNSQNTAQILYTHHTQAAVLNLKKSPHIIIIKQRFWFVLVGLYHKITLTVTIIN